MRAAANKQFKAGLRLLMALQPPVVALTPLALYVATRLDWDVADFPEQARQCGKVGGGRCMHASLACGVPWPG